jgi:hypothetical protein
MSKKFPHSEADPDFVVVVETDVPDAMRIAERLRSMDIPAVVKREAAWTAIPLLIGSLGQAWVLVPRAFYERAEAILGPDITAPPENADSR